MRKKITDNISQSVALYAMKKNASCRVTSLKKENFFVNWILPHFFACEESRESPDSCVKKKLKKNENSVWWSLRNKKYKDTERYAQKSIIKDTKLSVLLTTTISLLAPQKKTEIKKRRWMTWGKNFVCAIKLEKKEEEKAFCFGKTRGKNIIFFKFIFTASYYLLLIIWAH